jgi:predicted Fe-S protein YdhL (DUF1289 family)
MDCALKMAPGCFVSCKCDFEWHSMLSREREALLKRLMTHEPMAQTPQQSSQIRLRPGMRTPRVYLTLSLDPYTHSNPQDIRVFRRLLCSP